MLQEDETQVTGIIMIADLDGLSLSHAKNISPFYAKKISGLLQVKNNVVKIFYSLLYIWCCENVNFLIYLYLMLFWPTHIVVSYCILSSQWDVKGGGALIKLAMYLICCVALCPSNSSPPCLVLKTFYKGKYENYDLAKYKLGIKVCYWNV